MSEEMYEPEPYHRPYEGYRDSYGYNRWRPNWGDRNWGNNYSNRYSNYDGGRMAMEGTEMGGMEEEGVTTS